jgi:hypothetical protein
MLFFPLNKPYNYSYYYALFDFIAITHLILMARKLFMYSILFYTYFESSIKKYIILTETSYLK